MVVWYVHGLVSGVWWLVSGVWCLVSGVWCLVAGVWWLVAGGWWLVAGVCMGKGAGPCVVYTTVCGLVGAGD